MKNPRYRGLVAKTILPVALVVALGLTLAVTAPLLLAVPHGGYVSREMVIEPQELEALLGRKDADIRVIDVRHKAKYYLGHIPAAVQVWRPQLEDKQAALPGLMASREQMEKLLSSMGVGPQTTLVLYSDRYDQARLWWILAYYGFPLERMKLLDGGIDAWKNKGFPTQLTSPRFKRSRLSLPGPPRPSLRCTLTEIKAALADSEKVVLDVRSAKEYQGRETMSGAPKGGHLPGAKALEWKETLVSQGDWKGYWLPAAEIRKLLADLGVTPDKDIYLYGHFGARAAHTLFTLHLIGYPLEKLHLYDGGWIEWSRSSEPLETGPEVAPTTVTPPAGLPQTKPPDK